MTSLSAIDKAVLLKYQTKKEQVGPRFADWRNPAPYKVCTGGRGAGCKSWSIASLLVQKLNYGTFRWFCGREIQKTLEESSFALIWDTIQRLGYRDWEAIPSRSRIENHRTGSYFYFAGLKDLRAAKGLKGLENYDGAWVDEAEDIPTETWDVLIPTFRKAGSELWVSFNRNREMDPAYKMFFVNPPPGTMAMELRPGRLDNPWFPEKLLEKMEHDYATRPDIAEHIWGGKPKAQGDNCVFTRSAIRAAMNRKVVVEGGLSCGVDVARFGVDRSVVCLRQGMKVLTLQSVNGYDTIQVADLVETAISKNITIPIKIDVGYNPGVADLLKHRGYKIIQINFGGKPTQPDKYDNLATEMWFEFPIDEAEIPNDEDLMDELSERKYDYDKNDIKRIESKDKLKERLGRSPDCAEAVLLSFYTGKTIEYDEETRRALLARRNR